MSSLRGHAVVLDFWATWCGPCRAEAPILEKVSQRYRDRGVVVVGMNTSDQSGNARPWALEHHLTYPIAFDSEEVGQKYGVESLPTLVVISPKGKIIATRTGMTSDHEIEELLRSALD